MRGAALTMGEARLISFESPVRHQAVSDLIRRHSSNRTDVRRAALAGMGLSAVHEVLDLGCGFGFMAEVVANRVAADARLIGVDACPANEGPFLERVSRAGRRGEFLCYSLSSVLPWPDRSFDLVVASYALYFFPEVLQEIARVLSTEGRFLTITHAESSCRALLRVVGQEDSAAQLLTVIRRFSAENGADFLAPWFGEVERIDYENTLTFESIDFDDLLAFLHFKLPTTTSEAAVLEEPAPELVEAARSLLARGDPIEVEKNDAIFHCRGPIPLEAPGLRRSHRVD